MPKPFWKFTNALWLSGPSPARVRPVAAFHSNTWAAGKEKMNFRRGKLSELKGQVKRTLGSGLPQPPALGHHAPLPGFAWGPPGWLILTRGMSTLAGSRGLRGRWDADSLPLRQPRVSTAPSRLAGWLRAEQSGPPGFASPSEGVRRKFPKHPLIGPLWPTLPSASSKVYPIFPNHVSSHTREVGVVGAVPGTN